ncbi:hypothetical protein BDV40DRAFT_139605 [Aspergillus tamarii]|uniref:Secreted protein n=1 Tax=Aspergillus tamarii TaxID=41984 RepID=A0A5N6U9U8_ASPTM|nr:hypothetical protein BDV40DRAFT_139605 [Aspergillus tamarii]
MYVFRSLQGQHSRGCRLHNSPVSWVWLLHLFPICFSVGGTVERNSAHSILRHKTRQWVTKPNQTGDRQITGFSCFRSFSRYITIFNQNSVVPLNRVYERSSALTIFSLSMNDSLFAYS